MLSKKVLDAMREDFHEEFGILSGRDRYIQQMKADAFALISGKTPKDSSFENDVEDAITSIITSASLLGFYIGIRTGADMEKHLSKDNFPELILQVIGDLNE